MVRLLASWRMAVWRNQAYINHLQWCCSPPPHPPPRQEYASEFSKTPNHCVRKCFEERDGSLRERNTFLWSMYALKRIFYTGSTASTSLAWLGGVRPNMFFTPQNLGSPATCEQRSFDLSNEKAEILLFQDMPRWFCHLYPQYRLVLCLKWNTLKKLKRCLFYYT